MRRFAKEAKISRARDAEAKAKAAEGKGKSTGKQKKKGKALSSDTNSDSNESSMHPDQQDLNPEQTPEYRKTLLELQRVWLCEEHPGRLCFYRTLKTHKTVAFDAEIAWVLAIVSMYYFQLSLTHISIY